MRDARRFSTWGVSHGVQRHVLAQTTWSGSTVMARSGAAPLIFGSLTARFSTSLWPVQAASCVRRGVKRTITSPRSGATWMSRSDSIA